MVLILRKPKTCGCCGKEHTLVTKFTSQFQLYWFQCDCQSTLAVKVEGDDALAYVP